MALYSEMTSEELETQLEKLRDQGQKAFDEQNWQEYQVLMTKWYLTKSYLIRDKAEIEIGRSYRLTEEYDQLTVSKIEGVMAWGILMSNGKEKAVPIAMLTTES